MYTHLQVGYHFGLVLGLKLELELLCETIPFGFTCKCMMWGCGFSFSSCHRQLSFWVFL